MTDWHGYALLGLAAAAVYLLNQIFKEVRSIRRMMNADRRISNEIQAFDED